MDQRAQPHSILFPFLSFPFPSRGLHTTKPRCGSEASSPAWPRHQRQPRIAERAPREGGEVLGDGTPGLQHSPLSETKVCSKCPQTVWADDESSRACRSTGGSLLDLLPWGLPQRWLWWQLLAWRRWFLRGRRAVRSSARRWGSTETSPACS